MRHINYSGLVILLFLEKLLEQGSDSIRSTCVKTPRHLLCAEWIAGVWMAYRRARVDVKVN